MISKKIKFEDYLNSFYPYIKVFDSNNKDIHTQLTPIFYFIENDVLTISFHYYNFTIQTSINTMRLVDQFNKYTEEIGGSDVLNFEEWLIKNYMDSRGIQELR